MPPKSFKARIVFESHIPPANVPGQPPPVLVPHVYPVTLSYPAAPGVAAVLPQATQVPFCPLRSRSRLPFQPAPQVVNTSHEVELIFLEDEKPVPPNTVPLGGILYLTSLLMFGILNVASMGSNVSDPSVFAFYLLFVNVSLALTGWNLSQDKSHNGRYAFDAISFMRAGGLGTFVALAFIPPIGDHVIRELTLNEYMGYWATISLAVDLIVARFNVDPPAPLAEQPWRPVFNSLVSCLGYACLAASMLTNEKGHLPYRKAAGTCRFVSAVIMLGLFCRSVRQIFGVEKFYSFDFPDWSLI